MSCIGIQHCGNPITKLLPSPNLDQTESILCRQINASKEESMRGQEAEGDEDARDEGTYDDDYEMLQ